MTWLDYPCQPVPLQDCLTKPSETFVLLATADSHLRIYLEQARHQSPWRRLRKAQPHLKSIIPAGNQDDSGGHKLRERARPSESASGPSRAKTTWESPELSSHH